MTSGVDLRQFRSALGSFTTGVTIVTTQDEEARDVGLTANSFNSVSLEPPMVLWSLAKSSLSLPAFLKAPYFAVHVLAADQRELSDRFAKRGADKFANLTLERGRGGIPLLTGCTARFECKTAIRHAGGDHEIFVGEVVSFAQFDRPPLVFHAGRYARVVAQPAMHPEFEQSSGTAETEASFSSDFLGYLLGRAHNQIRFSVRQEFMRRGFTEADYYVLIILGVEDDRTMSEFNGMLEFTGTSEGDKVVQRLAARGLVDLVKAVDGVVRVKLSEEGRHTALEFFAITKAAEADAETNLSYTESQELKQLLRRLIRGTDHGGLPPILRKRR